jgi:glycosyltransferase involved in cell wall biosynthesis
MLPGCWVLVLDERDPLHPAVGGAKVRVAEVCAWLVSKEFEFTPATQKAMRCLKQHERVCTPVRKGWGITVIEASASGVRVLANDVPGLRSALRDREISFLAPKGNIAPFAERIGRLLADHTLADRVSLAGRGRSQHFDADRAARTMAQVLESARAQA